jgi:CheY-like chemotaxis protein
MTGLIVPLVPAFSAVRTCSWRLLLPTGAEAGKVRQNRQLRNIPCYDPFGKTGLFCGLSWIQLRISLQPVIMETRHRVLIVDDDPDVLELYRQTLSELPSRPEIFVANSGTRALSLLKAEPFRLMICDLRMPKMDGLQVLSIVRRQFPEMRTVVLTGVQDEEFRSRAYALGIDLYWLKPDTQQNMEMFLQCIESLLGRDSEGTGFRGVHSKSLIDLIQMECLSQSSTVLRVIRGSLVGRIWIQSGELIDAEIEGARGEAAFRRILEWKSGSFENLPAEPGRERTISKSVNALLLETAQAIDETSFSEKESGDQGEHRQTVWRLAALTRAGADFVVSHKAGESTPEGWGTDLVQEMGTWMRQALDVCHRISHRLQAGPVSHLEATGIDHRVVLLAQEEKNYLVGWPAAAKAPKLSEQSKQLVTSWDS